MTDRTTINHIFDKEAAVKSLGSVRLLNKVARLFLENGPGLLEGVNQAVSSQNHEALERSAHKLVSSMAYLAAAPTRNTASSLERMGRTEDMDGASEVLAKLSNEMDQLRVAIEALLQEEGESRES